MLVFAPEHGQLLQLREPQELIRPRESEDHCPAPRSAPVLAPKPGISTRFQAFSPCFATLLHRRPSVQELFPALCQESVDLWALCDLWTAVRRRKRMLMPADVRALREAEESTQLMSSMDFEHHAGSLRGGGVDGGMRLAGKMWEDLRIFSPQAISPI